MSKGSTENPLRGALRRPSDLYRAFRDLKDDAKETLLGVYLDESLTVRSYDVLSLGGADAVPLVPNEVFRGAILTNSHYYVLIHNHPSGIARPSAEDKRTMSVIGAQSVIMQRVMLDFIIVGANGYWSMHEESGAKVYSV